MLNFLSDNNSDEAQFHLKPLSRIRRRNAADTTAWTTRCVTESETPTGKRWFSLRMLQTTNSDVTYVGVEVSMYKTPGMFHVGAGNSICLFYSSGCKAEGGVFYNLTINQQTSSPCSHRETVQ